MESNNIQPSKRRGRRKVCEEHGKTSPVPEKKKKQMLPWSIQLILEAIENRYTDKYGQQLTKWSDNGEEIIISSIDCFTAQFLKMKFHRFDENVRFDRFRHNLNDWRFSCTMHTEIKDRVVLVSHLDGFFKRDFKDDWKNLRYGKNKYTHAELVKIKEDSEMVIDEQRETIAEQEDYIIEQDLINEQVNLEKDKLIEQQKMTIEQLKKEKEASLPRMILTQEELDHVNSVIDFLEPELMANKSSQDTFTINESHKIAIAGDSNCETDDEDQKPMAKARVEEKL